MRDEDEAAVEGNVEPFDDKWLGDGPSVHVLPSDEEEAAGEGAAVAQPFGLDKDNIEALRSNGLKPEEISGDQKTQAERVRELLHWFVRLSRGSANPKWTREHAFELAYYIATTDDRAPVDISAIEKEAWLKGIKATCDERGMMLRIGLITEAEFESAASPRPSAPEAGVREWHPIETAPTNKAILIHVPNLDYYGNDGVYAGMLVDMGTGRRWMTFGWAIGRDLGEENVPVAWREIPTASPLSLAAKRGQAE
jgi:hypothetical protein